MFDNAISLARIGGIAVRVTPSWLLIALLVVVTLFGRFADPARPVALTGTMAVAGALAFFLSILAHEIAHALEAQRRGVEVHGITLFLFGGVTEMHMEARRPRDEFAVSAIGPYVSLVVAAAMGLLVVASDALAPQALRPLADVAGALAWINLLLAVFNVIPGAPLDGGRVLRALLWAGTGDRARAMRLAARAGQGVGLLLVPAHWMAIETLSGQPPDLVSLAFTAFIGWFLFSAAASELTQARFLDAVGDRTVGQLAVEEPPRVPADRSVDAVRLQAGPIETSLVVAVDGFGHPVGILEPDRLRQIAPADRASVTIAELARPLTELPSIDSDAPATALIQQLREQAPSASGADEPARSARADSTEAAADRPPVIVEQQDGVPRRVLTEAAVAAAIQDRADGGAGRVRGRGR